MYAFYVKGLKIKNSIHISQNIDLYDLIVIDIMLT